MLSLLECAHEKLQTYDEGTAVQSLIEAWGVSRHPRIAKVVEAVSDRLVNARLIAARVAYTQYGIPDEAWMNRFVAEDLLDREVLLRQIRAPQDTLQKLDGPVTERRLQAIARGRPDPRATRRIVLWLQRSEFYSDGSWVARCEVAAAEAIVALRDVRFRDSLARHCARGRQHPRPQPVPTDLLHALEVLKAFDPPALSEDEANVLADIEDLAEGRALPSGRRAAVTDLLQAVYEDPDDDAPRRALAERLQEVNDPRGELITLQLTRHGTTNKPSRREVELLREHGRAWLGEISSIIDDGFVFQRGFPWQVGTTEAGLPKNKTAHSFPILATGSGTQDEWSTVVRLSVWRHMGLSTYGIVRGPKLGSLRELVDATGELHDVVTSPPRPLKLLSLAWRRTTDIWQGPWYREALEALGDAAPELETLSMSGKALELSLIERVVRSLPKLRVLESSGLIADYGDLIQLGAEQNLHAVRLLSFPDVSFDLATRVLEVELAVPVHRDAGENAAAAIRFAERHHPSKVIVRIPRRATTEGKGEGGVPLALVTKRDSIDLSPIWEAASELGIPFSAEEQTRFPWSSSPFWHL